MSSTTGEHGRSEQRMRTVSTRLVPGDSAEHRTVTRIATILEAVAAERGGLRLSALRDTLKAPKSSVHGLVKGLAAVGYLSERDGRYLLGPAVAALAATGQPSVADAARSSMERLHRQFDETVMLGSMVGDSLVYLETIESTQAVRYSPPRVRRHFENPSSIMKLYLAELSPEKLDEYLHGQIADPGRRAVLAGEIGTVRERGVAFNCGDTFRDLSAAAVGITEHGTLVACLAIGGPSHRMDHRLEEMAGALTLAAAEVARRLGRGPSE